MILHNVLEIVRRVVLEKMTANDIKFAGLVLIYILFWVYSSFG